MIRVLLVSPSFHSPKTQRVLMPIVMELLQTQHRVRVLTTFAKDHPDPMTHNNFEIMYPFKKWSFLESKGLMTATLGFAPDVVFMSFDSDNLHCHKMFFGAIPLMLQGTYRSKVLTHFFGPHQNKVSSSLKTLAAISATIFVPNHHDRLTLDLDKKIPNRCSIETHSSHFLHSLPSEDAYEIEETSFSRYLYAPAPITQLAEFKSLIESTNEIMKTESSLGMVINVHGKFRTGLLKSQIQTLLLTNERHKNTLLRFGLSYEAHLNCMRKSLGTLLHYKPLQSQDLKNYFVESQNMQKPCLVSSSFFDMELRTRFDKQFGLTLPVSIKDFEKSLPDSKSPTEALVENQISRRISEILGASLP